MKKDDLIEMEKYHEKNGENKYFIAILYKQSLILRVKTILLA